MKTTMYELLGMVKDGKAPKKIKYKNKIYEWKEYDVCYEKIMTKKGWVKEYGYVAEENRRYFYLKHCYQDLNGIVEIIEELKGIPEKLGYCEENTFCDMRKPSYLSIEERRLLDSNFKEIGNKINEIIDCLESKGE